MRFPSHLLSVLLPTALTTAWACGCIGDPLFRSCSETSNWVTAVDISPDGQHVAEAYCWGRVSCYALKDVTRPVKEYLAGKCVVNDLAFSPDGGSIAIAGIAVDEPGRPRAVVHLWSVNHEEGQRCTLKPPSELTTFRCLAFSADGKRLVAGGEKAVVSWALADSAPQWTWQTEEGKVVDVDFAKNDQVVVAPTLDRLVLLDASSGSVLQQHRSPIGPIECLDVAPRGGLVVTGGKNAAVWNLASGKVDWVLPRNSRYVRYALGFSAVAFSSDGRMIAAASGDRISVWLLAEKRLLRVFRVDADITTDVAFLPNGDAILAAALFEFPGRSIETDASRRSQLFVIRSNAEQNGSTHLRGHTTRP